MTTPPQIVAMLDWQREHAGELAYSQKHPDRLSSDGAHLTSPTDCSGLIARLYKHFAGLDVGTWTGNERNYGQLITTSKADAAAGRGMLPGDAVFFNWSGPNPTFDHVAMYAGNGRIWNHGGPGRGPNDWSLRDNVNNATEVMVRRFLAPGTSPATPNPTGEFTMDAEARAAFAKLFGEVDKIKQAVGRLDEQVPAIDDKIDVQAVEINKIKQAAGRIDTAVARKRK